MSEKSPFTPDRLPPEQVGPYAKLISDALGRVGSQRRAAALITDAAYALDGKLTTVHAAAVSRWLKGTIAQPNMRRWISKALDIPLDELNAAAKEQEATRNAYAQLSSDHRDPTTPQWPTLVAPDQPVRYGLNEDPTAMMRRQFLQQVLSVAGMTAIGPTSPFLTGMSTTNTDDTELLLQQCESNIRACWRLMQGPDMVVVPSVLTSWLPMLDSMFSTQPTHRRQLAALASEGYMLGGLVTVLQGQYDRSEWFCQQAVEHAANAGHPDLTVAALKHLATKYLDAEYPLLTLRTYERAVPLLKDASPLLRGRTYLGLALAHAKLGNRTDAERHLAMAHDAFPDDPEHDPAFAYTDARRASLNHYEGLMHLLFDRPAEAWETFEQALKDRSAAAIPERTVIELVNCQAEAAIALRDVELAASHVEASVRGAWRLRSHKRLRDSALLYDQLRARWPADARVKRLEELVRSDRPR